MTIDVAENGIVVTYKDENKIGQQVVVFEMEDYDGAEKALNFIYKHINRKFKIGDSVRVYNSEHERERVNSEEARKLASELTKRHHNFL
jgi:uncharacterized protein YheU (UPF0270 family)